MLQASREPGLGRGERGSREGPRLAAGLGSGFVFSQSNVKVKKGVGRALDRWRQVAFPAPGLKMAVQEAGRGWGARKDLSPAGASLSLQGAVTPRGRTMSHT